MRSVLKRMGTTGTEPEVIFHGIGKAYCIAFDSFRNRKRHTAWSFDSFRNRRGMWFWGRGGGSSMFSSFPQSVFDFLNSFVAYIHGRPLPLGGRPLDLGGSNIMHGLDHRSLAPIPPPW